jgi:cell division protein FtsN
VGRRDFKGTHRARDEAQAAKPRKGGGLGTGVLIGVFMGMAIAGGVYWFLNSQPSGLKPAETPHEASAKPVQPAAPAVSVAATPAPAIAEPPPPPERPAPKAKPPEAPKPAEAAKPRPAQSGKQDAVAPPPAKPAAKKPPASDYSFYDILPGKATPKPTPPAKAQETHWLQVAALRTPADAERLRARLATLGLPVSVQPFDNAGTVVHRVRVGPFKTEDDGLGALDTLSENNFEPRWVKDPVKP